MSGPLIRPRSSIAWGVLLVTLIPAILVWHSLRQQESESARAQFELHARAIVNAIQQRLYQHEQILLGGAGLFDASATVSRNEWHAYVARLRLAQNYPGIQGVGFSKVIAPEDLDGHVAAIRAEGFPEYTVKPPGKRDPYTAIIYLEPFSGRNLAAFGFDMYSEKTRHRAMQRAAESGGTAISGKVKLVQETHGRRQAGFLMYVPVYRHGMPTETPAQRWQALLGFVYSPYRVDDLMHGILGERSTAVDFSIYDTREVDAETLMHDSRALRPAEADSHPAFRTLRRISAYGHEWTISLSSRPEFDAQFGHGLAWLILFLGVTVSLALFALTASLVNRREQAVKIAGKMTTRIRESEERFRYMLETCPTAAHIARAGGHEVIFSNPRYSELINVPAGQASGVDPASYYANPTDYEDILRHIQAGEQIFDRLIELRIPGAGTKWALASYLPIQYEEQPAVLGWFYDITDRMQAASAMQEQYLHTQTILDNTVDGIITIDVHGNVASFNKASVHIFGYTPDEVIGQNVSMLMPEPYRSAHDGYLLRYLSTKVPHIMGGTREVSGCRKDGTLFPMELSVSEIQYGGEVMFIGMVRDITERKRVEKMKSEFVSTVSHELRTPLTSISGALGLLDGGVMGSLPESAKSLLDIALKNSRRLTLLINDLLDMEKISAGKLTFDMQVQPLMPPIDQALEANAAYAGQDGVKFALIGRDDDLHVRVDSDRLIQVLSNFLSNAAKFSPANGQVDVSIERREGHVRVSVIDRGPGVPEDFRPRLFEKFFQADSSDTRQRGGTGLGLAITKELVEHMRGQVGFESTEGHGATFYFELPLEPSSSSGPRSASQML